MLINVFPKKGKFKKCIESSQDFVIVGCVLPQSSYLSTPTRIWLLNGGINANDVGRRIFFYKNSPYSYKPTDNNKSVPTPIEIKGEYYEPLLVKLRGEPIIREGIDRLLQSDSDIFRRIEFLSSPFRRDNEILIETKRKLREYNKRILMPSPERFLNLSEAFGYT